MMRGTLLSAVLAVATLSGCYATGDVGYRASYGYSGGAYVSTPDLVYVSPGVQVVADYDEPVFYSDGYYWRYYNDGWYRSNNYATGWYYWERPPAAVLRIDRPYAYARYRPQGYARSRPYYRPAEPIVRDHRTYRPAPGYRDRPAPAPVVRDHRGYREVERPQYQPQPAPVVRDHRGYREVERPQYQPAQPAPVVRDHRTAPAPVERRPPEAAPAPVVRDHRAAPRVEHREERGRGAPAPVVRDHRR